MLLRGGGFLVRISVRPLIPNEKVGSSLAEILDVVPHGEPSSGSASVPILHRGHHIAGSTSISVEGIRRSSCRSALTRHFVNISSRRQNFHRLNAASTADILMEIESY